MKRFFQYLVYLAARGAGWLIGICPRSWYFFFGKVVAVLLFPIPAFGGISLQNVRAAYPDMDDRERKKIAKGSIANLIVSLCEFFWAKHHKEIFLPDMIEFSPRLQTMMASGHDDPHGGIIFITPHHGNWEFAGQMLSLKFRFKVSTIVRSPQNPYIGKLLSDGRMVDGVELIFSKGAARGIVSALKDGRTIGLLVDQNTRVRDGGDFVNFYGLPVPMTQLAAHLARKRDLRLMIGGVYREGRKLFMDGLEPELPCPEYTSDLELSQVIMNKIEDIVRLHPEQYLWMYRRFQNIPKEADEALKARYPKYAAIPKASFYEQSARSSNQKQQESEA